MIQTIFVNLPVTDVERSARFYEALGFTREPRFSQPGVAAAMVLSDTISFMLLSHEHFARFAIRPIVDAKTQNEVLLCISRESREAVDAMIEAADRAGGRIDLNAADDHGFMYGRSFEDPDGHLFEPMWMDLAGFDAAQAANCPPQDATGA